MKFAPTWRKNWKSREKATRCCAAALTAPLEKKIRSVSHVEIHRRRLPLPFARGRSREPPAVRAGARRETNRSAGTVTRTFVLGEGVPVLAAFAQQAGQPAPFRLRRLPRHADAIRRAHPRYGAFFAKPGAGPSVSSIGAEPDFGLGSEGGASGGTVQPRSALQYHAGRDLGETKAPGDSLNIDSYRRSLQRAHLRKMVGMILRDSAVPEDAQTLSRRGLVALRSQLQSVLSKPGIKMSLETRAHLSKSVAHIDEALKANMERTAF